MSRLPDFLIIGAGDVDGYRADLIAGEEPELCARLRAKGPRSLRVNLIWAILLFLGKFAEAVGNLKFLFLTLHFGRTQLIEYK